MFHGHTELLWIGCLTGSIWTQKSKSVTLTPNTNSQTSWPKGIACVMSGTIFFICSILAVSALFAAPKISAWLAALRWQKRIQEQKEGERVVSKSRRTMNVSSYFIATSSSAASSPIASKSLGMSGASERPDSRMSVEPSSFDAASISQVRLKDAYFGGLMEEQQGNLTHEKENFQKKVMILNLSFGVTSLFLKLTKLVGNHLQEKQQWWANCSVIQRTSKAGSSSCQCSTTLYGM